MPRGDGDERPIYTPSSGPAERTVETRRSVQVFRRTPPLMLTEPEPTARWEGKTTVPHPEGRTLKARGPDEAVGTWNATGGPTADRVCEKRQPYPGGHTGGHGSAISTVVRAEHRASRIRPRLNVAM